MESWTSSRPGSVAQAGAGPRPTLDDVLADRAQPPYTLTAFMAYLSQNHCLETLEFTMDAKRYGDHYQIVSDELRESPILSEGPRAQHLCALFERLLSAYVAPGAPREINLPSSVRDALLSHSNTRRPPIPSVLDAGVKRMRDLMDESIFIPFLNSRTPAVSQTAAAPSSETSPISRAQHRQSVRHAHTSTAYAAASSGGGGGAAGTGGSSAVIAAQRAGYYSSGTRGSSSGDSASGNLTDDSGSNVSSPSGGDPVTPPTTPYTGDIHSPRARQDNAWKKMGARFGWKK